MRSERLQFNQLCVQNVCNTYRKGALAQLLEGCDAFLATGGSNLSSGLKVFCEAIDFSLDEGSPEAFADSLRSRAAAHCQFVSAADTAVVDRIVRWAQGSRDDIVGAADEERYLSMEIVQEQEQVGSTELMDDAYPTHRQSVSLYSVSLTTVLCLFLALCRRSSRSRSRSRR